MRKGKGELTYKQLKDKVKKLERENSNLRKNVAMSPEEFAEKMCGLEAKGGIKNEECD